MMKKRLPGILLVILITTAEIFAGNGNIRLQGSTKKVVSVGETFQVVYQLNGERGSFEAPDFGGLQVLSGPNISSSSSVQFINGHISQSHTVTYSFYVQAVKEGVFHISPAAVTVNGKRITSNKLTVKAVMSGSATTQNNNPNAGNTRQNSSSQSGTVLSPDDIFIKAKVNNTSPYLGQQVILTYEIYTKVPTSNLNFKKMPSFDGFWSKDLLDDNAPLKQQNRIINGEQYVVAEIKKTALFPQKTGKLTIEPMELECNVQIRVQRKRHSRGYDPFEDFFNDPFFNNNVKTIKKILRSKPIVLNVKPLPQKDKPAGFSGAVGSFTFKSTLDRNKLTTNDALTLDISISGRGNIELIEAPKVQWPTDFDTYEPKITKKINATAFGISGRKKFEYVVVPRNPGDFIIPPVKFSFFNPDENKYYQLKSDTMFVHVDKGKGGGTTVYTSQGQEDIRFLNSDIHHIKSNCGKLRKKGEYFFASNLYYTLLALPVIILLLTIIIVKNSRKRRNNIVSVKNKKAHKMARNRLSKAMKLKKAGDDKAFYEEVAHALWGYISDKFNIPQAGLSMETVKEKLENANADSNTVDMFIKILNDIEFARFAPGSAKDKMEQIYSEALDAILKAEKTIK